MDIKYNLITLFPEIFPGPLGVSLLGNALQKKLWELNLINIRDFAKDRHKSVDDTPYGGGAGMVMKPDVIEMALNSISDFPGQRVCLTPRGKRLSQQKVKKLSLEDGLVLLCGRYEGIDERFIENYVDQEFSIGDFVLSGGEIPALALIDALSRKIPGVLGNQESFINDSFENNLLKGPVYTRPQKFEEKDVPEILLSGDHEKINDWKILSSLQRTIQRRPDLLDSVKLSNKQKKLLDNLLSKRIL